jgi:CRP-like cAMP-binding protein
MNDSIETVDSGKQDRSLAAVSLFRSLDSSELARVSAACTWKRAGGGEWLLDYKAQGTDLFFVMRGLVRVHIVTAAREVILRDIGEGEFFGELAALDGQPRSAAIQAVTDVTIARMTAERFRALIHAHPDVCDQVLAVLVGQVRMLANRVNEQSTLLVHQRLHAELLRSARRSATSGETVISPPPSHAELAARISTNREAVTRELNALEREGLIRRRRGAIVLLDPERMRNLLKERLEL